jgi:predicted NUDIX family NTP pyrophosphohydrolase
MKISAGILPYRFNNNNLQVFLVHPGGPYNNSGWVIPKGEIDNKDKPIQTAIREFKEETGNYIPFKTVLDYLGEVKQSKHKTIKAWAYRSPQNMEFIESNTFEIIWPPNSNIKQTFTEIDKGEWFSYGEAISKMHPKQLSFVKRLMKGLNYHPIRLKRSVRFNNKAFWYIVGPLELTLLYKGKEYLNLYPGYDQAYWRSNSGWVSSKPQQFFSYKSARKVLKEILIKEIY